ncbi:MAG: M4 family metallopeptidase, partial [Bacteroidia bacterium]
MKLHHYLLTTFLLGNLALFGQDYRGQAARNAVSGADFVRYEDYTHAPTWVSFNANFQLPYQKFEGFAQKNFYLDGNYSWSEAKVTTDELGFTHFRLQQLYKGVPVKHGIYLLHTQDGKITSMNGDIYEVNSLNTQPSLSEMAAFQQAKAYVNAQTYRWEVENENRPQGQLVIVANKGKYESGDFRLAYQFDIYGVKPLSRAYIYVDARTGEIVHTENRLHTADTPATAVTKYSGTQNMTTDSFSGGYRLREAARSGIQTMNMQKGTSYTAAVDFTDSDNNWNNVNANWDHAAPDAHWASEHTYDFFYNHYNRNSIDDQGMQILCYMHYDNNYFNAFWDGQRMTIGDGSGSGNVLSAIDIIGHEMTHGVTEFSAGLVYQDEPGGLNESFSDIFGTAIEFEAKPTTASWAIGSDIGTTLRSMSNPKQYQDPDTYQGQYWIAAGGPDNGGVHTNSGVQNHWYYLVSVGGTGTNDQNEAYNVTGIGQTKAAAISYRNLTTYLTANSDYADARQGAIQAAADLYGVCTPEVITTTKAWYAVGVGDDFSNSISADFSAPIIELCNVPFGITFNTTATNAANYSWNFGDGTTGTGANPTHTYTTFGNFTVTMTADAGACGSDVETKTNYISVDPSNPCLITMNTGTTTTQTTCEGYLFDTGGPSGNYLDQTTSKVTIAPSNAGTTAIRLIFNEFNVEENYDYLRIFAGTTTTGTPLYEYTGVNAPDSLTIPQSVVTIEFETDQAVNETGFNIKWRCLAPTNKPSANFVSNVQTTCDGKVSFTDLTSELPNAWSWNFGDGTTSTLQNPTHEYLQNGTYNVSLTATNTLGNDTKTINAYITVNRPNPPVANGVNIQPGQTATLNATGTAPFIWLNSSMQYLATGASYTTPALNATTTYYVQTAPPIVHGGPANNTFGNGGNFNATNIRYLRFSVTTACILKSVKIYADGAGVRNIEFRNSTGTVIQSKAANLTDGVNTVELNFDLPVGTNYQLGTGAGLVDMYRNSAGAAFPYNINGWASITGTNATQNGYYYYYYDWVLTQEGCRSVETPVVVTVGNVGINDNFSAGTLEVYPNPTSDKLTVAVNNDKQAAISYQLINLMGQTVHTSVPFYTATLWQEINVAHLAAGTYFLKVQVGNESVVRKVQ